MKEVIPDTLLGIYVNADEVEKSWRQLGFIDFASFGLVAGADETEGPEINISRVAYRVKMLGHDVPRDKIIGRYYRSLDLLADAIRISDRAYIFDNSAQDRVWLAEVTDGTRLEFKTDIVPHWFESYALAKFRRSA